MGRNGEKMKKEHWLLIKFATLTFVVFMGQAFTFTLILPYLESLGFDVMSRMLITAFGAVLTIIGQFVVGYLCDKFKTDKKVFYITNIIFALATWLLYSFNGNPVALIVLWTGLVSALFMITQGVLDSWIIESDKYCLDNYGWIRAFGAIGWAAGAPLTSVAFERWGYASMGNAFLIFTVISFVLAYFVADVEKIATKEKIKLSDIKTLILDRNFIILTLVFLFLHIASWTDGMVTILKIGDLGKAAALSEAKVNSFINLKYSFQAICELPLFFLGGWLIKKFGSIKIVIFAALMLAVRFVLYGLAVTPEQLVWSSGLQMVTFPLIMICSKILIDEASPAHLKASGQLISASVYGGMSSLVTPILCGWLAGSFSYDSILFGSAGLCIIPIVLLVVFARYKTQES